MTVRTDLFSTMFTQGFGFVAKANKHVFTVVPAGMLHLPTGRLVTGDAIATLDFEPLSRTAPTGVYPVEASLVTVAPDKSLVAGVRIVFSDAPIVSWELAEGGTGGAPGYTGPLGLFIDAQMLPALQAYIDEADGTEWWYDPPKKQGNSWEVACFSPDSDRPETCALFQTGDGDGVFASYWGLDASGAPALLITDFNVVP